MAELIGKVQYLKVGHDFCFAQILEDGTGVSESAPIWWYFPDDPEPSTITRSIESMQFELLRTALTEGLNVDLSWDESTGRIENLKLFAAP
jgi:hypothetical protein